MAKRGERPRGESVVQSLYLPPDDRRAAAEAYVEESRGRNGAVYVGGDLNMQTQRPRNDNEHDDIVMMWMITSTVNTMMMMTW